MEPEIIKYNSVLFSGDSQGNRNRYLAQNKEEEPKEEEKEEKAQTSDTFSSNKDESELTEEFIKSLAGQIQQSNLLRQMKHTMEDEEDSQKPQGV